MAEETIGVVGLGIMGGAMAANLRAAGWRVVGYDPEPTRAGACGAEAASDTGAVAREAAVLLTSLATPGALRETARAIAGSGAAGRTIIEASTMSLEDKLAFRDALPGHTVLDCPISGTGAQAVVRDLVVYASGDGAAIERLRPFFAAFTRAVHDVGAFGNGSKMKFVANLLVAIHNVAAAEAMVLGEKAGLDPQQVVKLVGAGVGTSRVFDLRAPMMAAGVYEPATMKVGVWQKDMAVIGAFAASVGAPTPLLAATAPLYDRAAASGHTDQDTASVHAVLARMAGLGDR